MNRATTLPELAERCEAATGPGRDLDGEIAKALWLPHGPDSGWCNNHNGDYWTVLECAKQFTASIDAALTLVPEGWLLQGLMERNASGQHNWRWKADLWRCRDDKTVRGIARVAHAGKAAPALAICAAALRARAAQ